MLKTHETLLHLEAVQGNKEPQDIVGALEDSEDSQIPHHSFHSRILQESGEEMMKNINKNNLNPIKLLETQ